MIVVATPSAHRGRWLSRKLKATGVLLLLLLCDRLGGRGQLAIIRSVWKGL